jgi:DNA-binding response OmpR family regulator
MRLFEDLFMARILFVDDEPLIRSEAAELLSLDGHDVLHAENGAQAVDILCENDVDLMILDMMMPEQDGIETIKEIRSGSAPMNQTKILAISSGGQWIDPGLFLRNAALLGANEVLPKPFSLEELRARIKSLLE